MLELEIKRRKARGENLYGPATFYCDWCGKKIYYIPIFTSPDPDGPAVCYECLSPEDRSIYDRFYRVSVNRRSRFGVPRFGTHPRVPLKCHLGEGRLLGVIRRTMERRLGCEIMPYQVYALYNMLGRVVDWATEHPEEVDYIVHCHKTSNMELST